MESFDVLGVLAGCCALTALYAYLGYPALIYALGRVRPDAPRLVMSDDRLPMVSVLLAVHNERGVIKARLENLLSQDYPEGLLEVLVVSDASNDGTDELIESMNDARIRLLRQPVRSGKTAGVNRIARLARGSIFVHTDANVLFSPHAVRALVDGFGETDVGVVIGEVMITNEQVPQVRWGEGLYWSFETWLKRLEAQLGLLIVANGGIYAIRRDLWQALPDSISADAADPLLAAIRGMRTTVARGALARERAAVTLSEEFARKTRIVAQQIACAIWIGIHRMPPAIAWAYLSHKLLRYAVPFLIMLGCVVAVLGGMRGSRLSWAILCVGVGIVIIVTLTLALRRGGIRSVPRILLYLMMVNAASATGLIRGACGRAQAIWSIAHGSRESELTR